MSITTVNKLLTLFGSLMIHCVKEGHRKDNPAEGLKVQQSWRVDEERKAFSVDDITKIDRGEELVIKPVKVFPVTELEAPDAPSVYRGEPLSLEDMEQAILTEAGKHR